MKLASYLAQNELSATAFAARVGVPASTIIRILTGARSPRLQTIARISSATGGLVDVADFMAFDPSSRLCGSGVEVQADADEGSRHVTVRDRDLPADHGALAPRLSRGAAL